MHKGILITDPGKAAALADFRARPTRSSDGTFSRYEVTACDGDGSRALVITGLSDDALRRLNASEAGQRINFTVDDGGQLVCRVGRKHIGRHTVLGLTRARRLAELVVPVPWRREPSVDMSVLFWLDDPDSLADLCQRSLQLDNDRVQAARVGDDGGHEGLLVRILSPHYYLVAWCAEVQRGIQVYYPMTGARGIYLPWGHEHPLAALWRQAWEYAGKGWLLFDVGGGQRLIQPPAWRSIYDLAEFELELAGEVRWRGLPGPERRFTVCLTPQPRHVPAEPDLVLLRDDEREQLERFLATAAEEEVSRLRVAVLDDGEGGQLYLVQAARRRDRDTIGLFTGLGLAAFRGMEELYLPVDLTLEPPLRRDRYRNLLELKADALTLLLPLAKGGPLQRITVPRKSFRPLDALVDHLATFEGVSIASLLERSPLDLGRYKLARPARPLAPARQRERQRRNMPARTPEAEAEGQRDPAGKRRRRGRRLGGGSGGADETADRPGVPPDRAAMALRQAEIEREIIRRGGDEAAWTELMQIREAYGEKGAAARCAMEAIWSGLFPGAAPEPDSAGAPQRLLPHLQRLVQGVDADEPMPAAVAAMATAARLHGEQAPKRSQVVRLASWRPDAALPIKVRWLARRDIWRLTGDQRAVEAAREDLLTQLNERGLAEADTPGFIKIRLHQDFVAEQDGDSDARLLRHLGGNMDIVEEGLDEMRLPGVRAAARASLARLLTTRGHHAAAQAQLEQARGETSRSSAEDEVWPLWVRYAEEAIRGHMDNGSMPRVWSAGEGMTDHLRRVLGDRLEAFWLGLAGRQSVPDMAELVAAESRTLFPSSALPNEVAVHLEAAGLADGAGDAAGVATHCARALGWADQLWQDQGEEGVREVARVLTEAVGLLRRNRWAEERSGEAAFDALARQVGAAPMEVSLYSAALRLSLARGLLALDRAEDAERMARVTLARLTEGASGMSYPEQFMSELDLVDLVRREALLVLEGLPLEQRRDPLRELLEAYLAAEKLYTGGNAPRAGDTYIDTRVELEVIKMLDHVMEAAISSRLLIGKALRDFEEREEFLLRRHLQRDQPCGAAAPGERT